MLLLLLYENMYVMKELINIIEEIEDSCKKRIQKNKRHYLST